MQALQRRDVSARELVDDALQAIERVNPSLGALVYVDPDSALDRADRIDREISSGKPVTPGLGLPSADKDLVRRGGMPTSYGSRTRADGTLETESDPAALWLDRIGAISVGKTATSEFGLSGYTEPLHGGAVRNPHNLRHGVGGSSGGAAAAVAAGLLPFAPGSDGGGSIRIPALACGVAGWKPSRGLVPWGSGFEHLGHLAVPGLIARSVADVALLAPLFTKGSGSWATLAPRARRGPIRRIGVTASHPWPADWGVGPDAEASRGLNMAADALAQTGMSVEWWDWQPASDYAEHFFTLWCVSAASIDLDPEQEQHAEPLTRFLRERGRGVSGVELAVALSRLKSFERDTIRAFSRFDAVLTPGLAMPAPEIGWFDQVDPERNFRQQVQFTPWTSFVNVAGLPAVSVPTHLTGEAMPMGVQLVGRPGDDSHLLDAARHLQETLPGGRVWPEAIRSS